MHAQGVGEGCCAHPQLRQGLHVSEEEGGRLQVDEVTGDVTAVLSRDRDGATTVHPADALVFAIGITGLCLSTATTPPPVWR